MGIIEKGNNDKDRKGKKWKLEEQMAEENEDRMVRAGRKCSDIQEKTRE